uniref:U23-Liphistoxin-Lsp1a_1 n=2 Tax=Liphistius TaxID=62150 RepID=A0A4Q8K307_9ARAC
MEIMSAFLLLIMIIFSFVSEGLAIKCYICSYSPDDRNNRTDKCTDDNFQPQKVVGGDCKLGCETFIQYDANEVLEHWRRNCVQEGTEVTDDCRTDKNRIRKRIRCTCDRDLCNAGTTWTGIHLLVAFSFLIWTVGVVTE